MIRQINRYLEREILFESGGITIQCGEKHLSNKWFLNKKLSPWKMVKLDPDYLLWVHTYNKSLWIKDLGINSKALKLCKMLQENVTLVKKDA